MKKSGDKLFDLQKLISVIESRKNTDLYDETKETLNIKHNELMNIFEKNKPFYSEDVYKPLKRILNISLQNSIKSTENSEHCFENFEDLNKEIDNALKKIRIRINTIRISE